MALLSAGVALAPATCLPPTSRFWDLEGLLSESFFLVSSLSLPFLTLRVVVFQMVSFLRYMTNQGIDVDY